MTVSNLEVLVANAARRALAQGETHVVPRVSDLDALAASTSGKIEIESMEDGRDGQIIDHMLRQAVLEVFKNRFSTEELRGVVDGFEDGMVVHVGDDLPVGDYVSLLEGNPALQAAIEGVVDAEAPAVAACAVELVLEGLHLSKRLNKDSLGSRSIYRGRG